MAKQNLVERKRAENRLVQQAIGKNKELIDDLRYDALIKYQELRTIENDIIKYQSHVINLLEHGIDALVDKPKIVPVNET